MLKKGVFFLLLLGCCGLAAAAVTVNPTSLHLPDTCENFGVTPTLELTVTSSGPISLAASVDPPFVLDKTVVNFTFLGSKSLKVSYLANNLLQGAITRDLTGNVKLTGLATSLSIPITARVIRCLPIPNPEILDFGSITSGTSTTKSVQYTLATDGVHNNGPLNITFTPSPPLTLNSTTATISPTAPVTLQVTVPANIPVGPFTGTVTPSKGNTLTVKAVVVAPGKPDLKPTIVGDPQIIHQPDGKNKVTVKFKVLNKGTVQSKQCNNHVLLDDASKADFSLPEIAPGDTLLDQTVAFITGKHDSHTVKIQVDANDQNQEGTQGEGNNFSPPVTIQLP